MTNVSEVLFYERPVPLNREAHKDLRIKPILNLAFSAKAHSTPLACVEFPLAAHSFPILFAGSSAEDLSPIALLGIRQNENLMVGEDGQWAQGTYIPAFVRRYPFVLAQRPEGDENPDNFAVFLDEAYEGFDTEEGNRLFNEDGSDSEVLKQAVGFLGEFQQHIVRTQEFVQKLKDLDLLIPRNIEVRMPDKDTVINGLFVVDEQKLHALDAKTLHELMQDGTLTWIFAHLFSLSNLDHLIQRMHERFTPEERAQFEAKMKAAAESAEAGNDA
jgi:hypothetical protein